MSVPIGLDVRVEAADPLVVNAVRDLARWIDDSLARAGSAPAEATLVWAERPLSGEAATELAGRADSGRPVLLLGPTFSRLPADSPLVAAAGIAGVDETPTHEIRLRPGAADAESHEDLVVTDRWLRVGRVASDVASLRTAMAGLDVHPVMTWRPSTSVGVLTVGATPATLTDPDYRRMVHRWVRHAIDVQGAPPVRVGILGFGAIGLEHVAGCHSVPGLELVAVCDKSEARLAAARDADAGLRTLTSADDLLGSDDVDLVVVSTPPNTHAEWALRAVEAGKHVVVEKPFCLSTVEADKVIAAAEAAGRIATVYQNRRWDADYLTVKRFVRSGVIGSVFHYESFVGGYGHPCNFWHSDENVSGGAIYDWGSHYLDWALDLFGGEVLHVTAATHKRRWHDVTNADHSRVTVRFADGVEAEFTHSDLAAAMKPKWYVLGTEGAIVGHWRQERVVARNAVGGLVEDRLAAADAPADLSVHAPDGSVTSAALTTPPAHPFHRELAGLLRYGEPMSVNAVSSRRNIAVMEAAVLSARDEGRPVRPA